MRFRILGPVRMLPRTPSAAKPRAVLATLLVQYNHVVSTHTLIDELWSGGPPRTAATTLQVYVSQLRKALLEEADPGAEQPLITRPPGYLIQLAPHDLDLASFEQLRAEGRTAYENGAYDEASVLLGRGLDLWTGSALSGIPQGPSLETNAIRLNELRIEVLEQRISADLKLGRHHKLTGELMALAHEYPMREALHCRLMVALYRSGRQSDALQAYHRARHALIEELGVEPGPALSRLLERVLASDPSLAWHKEPAAGGGPRPPADHAPANGPGPGGDLPVVSSGPALWLPPAVADFAGREDELALGMGLLAAESPAPGKILALSGRTGAGKTALAVQLAHSAAAHFPDGRILLPLRDATGRPVEPGAALATLLRRLRPGVDSGTPTDAGELSDLLHDATRGRKLLLIMDGVTTEAQVRPLLSAVPDSTVILTSTRTLAALEGAHHLVLGVLSPQDAELMLLTSGGPRMGEDLGAVAEIARLCGHLPLALRVAAAGLAARPHWTAAGLAKRLLDERTRLSALTLGDLDVRAGLLASYRDLDTELRRAFRLLALAPVPDFALWSIAALLATDLPMAERYADELVRSHLLEVSRQPPAASPGRYALHSLLRALVVEVLAEDDPRAVGAAAQRLGRAFLDRARHADAVLAPGRDRLTAHPKPVAGAPPDLSVGETPLQWFREETSGLLEAVRQTHAAQNWQLCHALASASAGYFEACARWDDWQSSHDLALDAALRAQDVHAEAVVLRSLGDLAWQRRDTVRATDRYRRARQLFTRCGDRAGAARCLTGEADVLLGQDLLARAWQGYDLALTVARTEDDARGRTEALRGLALVALRRGQRDTALEWLAESAAEAERLGDRRLKEHANRTADAIRAAEAPAGRDPVEVRPGVWLIAEPILSGVGAG
ncbi:BTAD domain-containing putative transcriptional regulator [Streptomyces sp. A5-4]|uniref:AfsR/SARP family transcriptional regulator n=1 Tax=Streptomyces sp. A5-4 TaxID=3384771 RepID=UPI003DA8B6FF